MVVFLETVAELPGLPSPCTMQCCQGVLTAFGVGFTPHIQRKARTDLRLRPHPVDTLLHPQKKVIFRKEQKDTLRPCS
jgi:hypothetical protein